ncbi:MAG: hypothetical protein HYU64_11465 [Armatimonadetes bacterium]|nr:hypothetical protein [Armatimonadota bacterium]
MRTCWNCYGYSWKWPVARFPGIGGERNLGLEFLPCLPLLILAALLLYGTGFAAAFRAFKNAPLLDAEVKGLFGEQRRDEILWAGRQIVDTLNNWE